MSEIPYDFAAYADFRRDQLEATFPCPNCEAKEPARIEASGCEQCSDFPRCGICKRWVGDGSGYLPEYVNVQIEGKDVRLCVLCFGEAS